MKTTIIGIILSAIATALIQIGNLNQQNGQ